MWGADGLLGPQSRDAQGVVRSSYFLYDAQGNLAQTVDGTTGTVTSAASFTAWGEVVPRADGTTPGVGSFGYGAKFGYLRDAETGFYLATYRHYDPSAGRWITRDPIGYNGGSNLYGYVDNDPTNATDPLGLARVELRFKLVGAGVGGLGIAAFIPGAGYVSTYHAFLVISNNDGSNPYYIRGGRPESGDGRKRKNAQGQELNTVYYGRYVPNTPDWVIKPELSYTLVKGDCGSVSDYMNRLTPLADGITRSGSPYTSYTPSTGKWGPNSNTTIRYLLQYSGIIPANVVAGYEAGRLSNTDQYTAPGWNGRFAWER